MTCTNGESVTPCKVDFNNTTLTIILPNGDQLTARCLGRWNTTTMEGKTQRSCRMRIDLGDEVVYGLWLMSASEGAQLIWSRGWIRVPDFQQPRS
jgi:translation initiation factor IF-1